MTKKIKIRQLTSDEKRLCESSITRFNKRRKHIVSKVKYYTYMLSEGLMNNYKDKYDEFLKTKKDINEELYQNDMKMMIIQRQIQEGVEVKNKIKVKTCSECGQEET